MLRGSIRSLESSVGGRTQDAVKKRVALSGKAALDSSVGGLRSAERGRSISSQTVARTPIDGCRSDIEMLYYVCYISDSIVSLGGSRDRGGAIRGSFLVPESRLCHDSADQEDVSQQ